MRNILFIYVIPLLFTISNAQYYKKSITVIGDKEYYLLENGNLDKGIQLFENGEYEKAKFFFIEKVKENEDDAEANYYLGRTWLMLGDYDKAIDYCEEAIELNNTNADYHCWLGNAIAIKALNSGILKQAWLASDIIGEYKRTIKLNPQYIGGHKGAAEFYLGSPSYLGGDLEKAHKEVAILLKLKYKKAYIISAKIYIKEGKYNVAEQEYDAYEKSFNDSTDNYFFYNIYGYFLLEQGNYTKAIKMFQKQVKLVPDNANAYDSLGDGYRAAGRITEAIAEYEAALRINPGFEASKKKLEELKQSN